VVKPGKGGEMKIADNEVRSCLPCVHHFFVY
jgi:hypothetical protein